MLARRLFGISVLLVWTGCSSNGGTGSSSTESTSPGDQTGTGSGGGVNSNGSNSKETSSAAPSSGSASNQSSSANTGGNAQTGATASSGSTPNSVASSITGSGASSNASMITGSTATGTCAYSCQAQCRSQGGTLKDGTCPDALKCCDLGAAAGGGTSGNASGGSSGRASSGAGGSVSGGASGKATGGAANASGGATVDTVASTGPCEYECTDFCVNAGGTKMPGSCSKTGHVCCNVEAATTTATGTQYYVDSKSGSDSKPFTKEAVMIGVTSGHNNNLFGPSTVNLERRWTLAATEKKVDDLGLVDVFHPTANSPAVDKGSDEGLYDEDFYGNKKCGSAPDVGAVEFCENAATKAKSDEVAKYLELNSK